MERPGFLSFFCFEMYYLEVFNVYSKNMFFLGGRFQKRNASVEFSIEKWYFTNII